MLLEKGTTCIRSTFLFEKDVLLAISIIFLSALQIAWILIDARPQKKRTERNPRAGSF